MAGFFGRFLIRDAIVWRTALCGLTILLLFSHPTTALAEDRTAAIAVAEAGRYMIVGDTYTLHFRAIAEQGYENQDRELTAKEYKCTITSGSAKFTPESNEFIATGEGDIVLSISYLPYRKLKPLEVVFHALDLSNIPASVEFDDISITEGSSALANGVARNKNGGTVMMTDVQLSLPQGHGVFIHSSPIEFYGFSSGTYVCNVSPPLLLSGIEMFEPTRFTISVIATPDPKGSISGVATWRLNDGSTITEAGLKVVLFPNWAMTSSDLAWARQNCVFSIVDGSGAFQINDVVPGDYVLFLENRMEFVDYYSGYYSVTPSYSHQDIYWAIPLKVIGGQNCLVSAGFSEAKEGILFGWTEEGNVIRF